MGSGVWVALRRRFTIGVFFSLVAVSAINGVAQTPTLVWDPSPDPSAIGYRVFWGTSSGSYTNSLDVGTTLTFVIPNGIGGQQYFMAVAAYNAQGIVGPRSPEVSAILPAPTAPAPTAPAPIPIAPSEDLTPPEVIITLPTTQRNHHTMERALVVGGTASDDTGVSSIRWQNSRGGEGQATGTNAWIANIPLNSGSNGISITAIDTAGNSSKTKITIYRRSE